MKRRTFLLGLAAAPLGLTAVTRVQAESSAGSRLLVLVALKGGNDGLNTLIPFADPAYYDLRPKLAVARDQVIKLTEGEGLHPSLEPLLDIWDERELAILRGVGYPAPNLSHFRSMDIWETASRSDETLTTGWLARALAPEPGPARGIIDGAVVGTEATQCLQGADARVVTISDLRQFQRQAKRMGASPSAAPDQASLRHMVHLEDDIRATAEQLKGGRQFQTTFPDGAFGRSIHTASELIANRASLGLAVVHLTLTGFDTHIGQAPKHARLLQTLGAGLASLRAALKELNAWDDTLVLTYSEFGRRARENANAGTDHGTANPHFVLGGRVKGGLYGHPVDLADLDGNGNLKATLDFRSLYASALEGWWGMDSQAVLGGRFDTLALIA
ncbi:DUF1501 domain-containing protein [Thiocystis violacea]|uniref:DUF1501 domain-containing protein n=1 Tax=Thiocystis violacea TaxID=13725 RepID=UPI00190457DB|nr:DUF1501 domain-containing protein [Thiocystis violacea]MBK1722965.1 hypothetical protein [Thiocystis violacea]